MNKTEIKRQINSRFYQYVNDNFQEYEIDGGEGNGRIYLTPKEGDNRGDNSIEYHQSRYDLVCLNCASKKTHEDVAEMQSYISNNIIPFVNTVLEF
jgi:hypothetical protein